MMNCPTCGYPVAQILHHCPGCSTPLARAADQGPAQPYLAAPGAYPAGLYQPGLDEPGPCGPDRYDADPDEPGPYAPALDATDLYATDLDDTDFDEPGLDAYGDDPSRPEAFADLFAGGGPETGAFPALMAPQPEAAAEPEDPAGLLYPVPGPPRRAAGRRAQIISAALAAVALLAGAAVAWTAFGQPQAVPGARLAGRGTAASHRARPAPPGHGTPSPPVPAPGGAAAVVSMAPGVSQAPDAAQVNGFLVSYFTAINAHNYPRYAGLLIPARRAQLTAADFAQGYGTTTDTGASLVGISVTGHQVAATVTFTSQQRAAPGANVASCTYWDITLYLRTRAGGLLIGNPPAGYHAYHHSCP